MIDYIGGKGLATYYFVQEVPANCDALSAENKLFFAPGAFSGSPVPASSRFHTVTKSPLTHIYLDCSSGGHFGPELAACDISLLILEGESSVLTGIEITSEKVSFHEVENLAGLGIYDTEKLIHEQFGGYGVRVLSIGLAGERCISYACMGNDFSRHVGRGGAGAVMGSKRVKFIAVHGNSDVIPSDPKAFKQALQETGTWISNNPWVPGSRAHGTAGNVATMSKLAIWPTWNFSGKSFDHAHLIDHEALEKKLVRRLSCANCPVSCSKGYRDTIYTDGEIEGPEYETLALLGSNIGLDDPDGIAALNYLCNQYGLDTITTGAVLGMIFDALRSGDLTYEEIGLSKKSSLTQQAMQLIKIIVENQGIGKVLAQGSRATATYLKREGDAPEVKGLDIAGYDPRASAGMALAYQTSDRGACHLRSFPIGRELSGVLSPGDSTEGKAEFVSTQQNAKAAQECLGICQFPYGIGINSDCIAKMLSTFTGEPYTVADLILVGERIWNMSRLFNCAQGISRKDDYLPKKISENPIQYGPIAGRRIDNPMQNIMLDEYYACRGWDAHGIPTASKIKELHLTLIAKKIQSLRNSSSETGVSS
jgi:aldehyde:ferredoxin oxidoreductase